MKLKVVHFPVMCYFADTVDINSNRNTCWISRFVVTVKPETQTGGGVWIEKIIQSKGRPGLSKTRMETVRCISRENKEETGYYSVRRRSLIFLVWREFAESPRPPCTRRYASSGTSPGRRGTFGATKKYHRLSLQTTLTTVIPVFSRRSTWVEERYWTTRKRPESRLNPL